MTNILVRPGLFRSHTSMLSRGRFAVFVYEICLLLNPLQGRRSLQWWLIRCNEDHLFRIRKFPEIFIVHPVRGKSENHIKSICSIAVKHDYFVIHVSP